MRPSRSGSRSRSTTVDHAEELRHRPWPLTVAIADLNGDVSPDLATADSRGDAVSVLLNRGDGTFRPRHDYPTGRAPSSLAVGDVNGDDKPDVVTGNGGKTVSILLNAGNGSFRTSVDYPTSRTRPASARRRTCGERHCRSQGGR